VVAAHELTTGEKQLIAYIVAEQQPISGGELRTFLRNKLPGYMVPAVFVFLHDLPHLPNGKIDRSRLPAPDAGTTPEIRFVAPRNDVELRLAKIWEEILGLSSVAVHDNFFDLGGHSLLALRLLGRVEKEFNRAIPVAALLERQTIESF